MWKFKQNPFEAPQPLAVDSTNWSNLQKSPTKVIPYRILMGAIAITALVLLAGAMLGLPVMQMIIGYWLGVLANLINFRGIEMSASRYLEKAKMGLKPSMLGGFLLRQLVAATALYLGSLLGIWAMGMTFLGLSMVKFVVNLDSFFSFKNR
ncbi:MAG: hypothetical protein FWF59_02880 [Turicibacter sp.]|nr:hypothetical protein [Turicibacter sp.]